MTNPKPAPKKRGRPPKAAQAESQPAAQAGAVKAVQLGVTATVAHSPLSLLQVQDSADLDALFAQPALRPMLVTRLDSCTALVAQGREKQVLEQLRKAGHTPKVVGSAP